MTRREQPARRQAKGDTPPKRDTQPLDVGACTCYVQALAKITSKVARSIDSEGAASLCSTVHVDSDTFDGSTLVTVYIFKVERGKNDE